MKSKPFSFWGRMKEISMFFEGRGKEHKTMRRLVKKLEKAKIAYAIIGGMAVNAHRYERTTKDVNVLLTQDGLEKLRRLWVPRAYDRSDRPRRFVDRKYQCTIDVLVAGRFPGSGRPGPIAFPKPEKVAEVIEGVRVVDLLTLIELKLAARRWQDFADVVKLIAVNNLDESFAARLHPSVRNDYIECVEEKRREEEYDARQLGAEEE